MLIQSEIQKIPLTAIALRDHTCRISSPTDPALIETLAAAIEFLGLLQPPIIIKHKHAYRIISGFRRVMACQRLGRTSIQCQILDRQTPLPRYAPLAVAENAWQRPLNLMEKARAFALLKKNTADAKQLAEIAKPLGIDENRAMVAKLLRLNNLSDPIQQAVGNGAIGLSMALTLGTLEETTCRQILAFFRTLRLGLNRQRQLLELIREIAKRESITMEHVLGSCTITAILNRSDQDLPTRSAELLHYLKKRRYPFLTEMETRFERLKEEVSIGARVQMVPPPYFEGKTYQLAFKFDTLKELDKHQRWLGRTLANPRLKLFLEKRLKNA